MVVTIPIPVLDVSGLLLLSSFFSSVLPMAWRDRGTGISVIIAASPAARIVPVALFLMVGGVVVAGRVWVVILVIMVPPVASLVTAILWGVASTTGKVPIR